MIINGEQVKRLREDSTAYFMVISQHSPGDRKIMGNFIQNSW
jgi:hypothetical protein